MHGNMHGNRSVPRVAEVFADNLRRSRRIVDLNQEQFAARAAIHRTEVSLLERAGCVPRIDTLLKLAGALEAAPAELAGRHRMDSGRAGVLRRLRVGAAVAARTLAKAQDSFARIVKSCSRTRVSGFWSAVPPWTGSARTRLFSTGRSRPPGSGQTA